MLDIYQQLNKRLFDNSLPICQITFYPIKETYGEVYVNACKYNGELHPVVVLNPQYFIKGSPFIISVLLHEMVHIHCHIKKIYDINYKTGYHTKHFKKECERVLLNCGKSANYGYNLGSPKRKLKIIINEIIKKVDLVNTLSKYTYNI